MEKTQLRADIKIKLAGITPEHAAEMSREACNFIIASPQFAQARCVMIYLPFAGEIDPTDIATQAWACGKRVLVPKVSPDEKGVMVPIEITSLTDGLEANRWGIAEPISNTPANLGDLDLIVTPGIAFDRTGYRLGRGGGYYDRFLTKLQQANSQNSRTCAIAFDVQLVDKVPACEHDRPVDMLATNCELLTFTH